LFGGENGEKRQKTDNKRWENGAKTVEDGEAP
jgi:hypothetical protein